MGLDGAGLGERLGMPVEEVSPHRLAAEWFCAGVSVECALEAELAGGAEGLPGKLRGAWGDALKSVASSPALAGQACPWDPACALAALMQVHGRHMAGLEIPKPYLIRCDLAQTHLSAALTLMGFASEWLEEAAAALVLGLRQGMGFPGQVRILQRRLWSIEGLEVPPVPPMARMTFLTPLEVAFKPPWPKSLNEAFARLMRSLVQRIIGLARWQDRAVPLEMRAIKQAAMDLEIRIAFAETAQWQRYSRRQRRSIHMQGDRVILDLKGNLTPLWPFLIMGQTTHTGRHTALGMGRFELQY